MNKTATAIVALAFSLFMSQAQAQTDCPVDTLRSEHGTCIPLPPPDQLTIDDMAKVISHLQHQLTVMGNCVYFKQCDYHAYMNQ